MIRGRFSIKPNNKYRSIHSFLADQRASNAVEFALISPVLVLLVSGIICAALYLAMVNSLVQLAADTARYAMVGLNPAERIEMAEDWISNTDHPYVLIDHNKLTVRLVEKETALVVSVMYDASALPLMPMLLSTLNVPSIIERSTTVLLP